jgi:hypothetical protein
MCFDLFKLIPYLKNAFLFLRFHVRRHGSVRSLQLKVKVPLVSHITVVM